MDVAAELPPCGLYRTVKPIGSVEAGRLVYFHNHGNPGAGVYFPEKWNANRAVFSQNGMTVPDNFDPSALRAVPAEGFYRVTKAFYCCEKKCTQFEPDQFVQLGYNGAATPLVFVPEITATGIYIPERGTIVDDKQLPNLVPLKLPEREQKPGEAGLSLPRGIIVH